MNGAGPAIVAQGLTKRYGEQTVVRDLSFDVARGSIFGFLGPNGSGKSTTIKMLCGLVTPNAGRGSVDGFDVERQGDQVRAAIGYMSQQFSLYGDLTVDENLEFYGRAYNLDKARRERRKREVTELAGIGQYSHRLAAQLSGGWKQRLALATAFLHEPNVLFLDEPTAGIDPVARRDLWDLLFRLAETGVTLFVTTHYMDEAERCSRVGYIFNGELIALGTLEELRHLPGVQPAGTVRYAVHTVDVMPAFSAAKGLAYVKDVTIFGRDLHLVVAADVTPERLRSDLAAARAGIEGIERIEPSLEDVFVALTRSREFA
ncbi:MAG TPA: ABC transporter ATP-binding protein [Candidatus Eremiobacteraceae bacterium]|nr:ABC transporter ATP-binding protein [Candidatus Eremiobacteraceae bacterium]